MEAKYRVTLIVDVNFESDVRTFLNHLNEDRYWIEKIESLRLN